MRLNSDTVIVGSKTILVPYEEKHVEKYHAWMQSSELQELTASEPLSLAEEYAMQASWRQDEDKLTFIVLDRQCCSSSTDEIDCMAGDVNLFLNEPDDRHVAEIEVMIAESSCRGRGLGREAVDLMMLYAIKHLAIVKFTSKIGMDNAPSLNMFKKYGFVEVSVSEVFREVTLERPVTEELSAALSHRCEGMMSLSYSNWTTSIGS